MVRPLQHIKDTPRAALNIRVFTAILAVGLLGISRGGDEGITGTMVGAKGWQEKFNVEKGSAAESNIVSMLQIGNVAGSLFTFLVADRIGRVRTIQLCILIWILGTAIWFTSDGSVAQTLGGRFVAGIGVGGFPVVCPTFLAEIAPRTVRGLAMTIYAMSVYIGIVVGYGANLGAQRGFSTYDDRVWKIPISTNFIWAGLFFIASFFVRESPRALAKKGQHELARETLSWYRGMPVDHPYVREELEGIFTSVQQEAEAKHGKNTLTLFKELFTRSSNLYKLIAVGFAIQILGQWSGGGSLTIYAQRIFELVGVESNASLYTTCIFGVVKLLSGLACSLFLIDFIGRKKSVFIGIGLQTLAALYLAVYVASLGDPDAQTQDTETTTQRNASYGAIVMIFISGIGWAMGFNSVQYVIGTEIWQMELRAIASSLIMAVHFANQYGSSRALNPMLEHMDRWGLFCFWTVIGVLAAIYILFFIPETSGRSLESMEELFAHRRWYQVGMLNNKVILPSQERTRLGEEDVTQLPSTVPQQHSTLEEEKGKDSSNDKKPHSTDAMYTRTDDA